MKDVRFYLEFENSGRKKRSGKDNKNHDGNVFAGFPDSVAQRMDGKMDGIGAVHYYANSPVASTVVSLNFLRTRCKRIPEKLARQIHPALFERLDSNND